MAKMQSHFAGNLVLNVICSWIIEYKKTEARKILFSYRFNDLTKMKKGKVDDINRFIRIMATQYSVRDFL